MTAERVRAPGTPLDRVLGALPHARHVGRGWQARCPAHDDRRASLSITEGDDGRVLLKCFATCDTAAVLQGLGLAWADLFPPDTDRQAGPRPKPPRARIVATYDYCDPDVDGALNFQVVRFEPKDFRQRRPDKTSPDGWTWKAGNRDLVYRLPELLAAPADAWVLVLEGEKDVNRATELGLVATCNAGGAGKWRAGNAEHLRGRRVAILPDNDDAGRTHAVQVATSLEGLATEIRIVELPDLPDKGDVSDWLAAGGTPAALLAAVEAAPRWEAAPAPETPCERLACVAERERLLQRVAELEQHQSLVMDALANPHLSAVQKIAAVALAFQVASATSRGQAAPIIVRDQIAERAGISADTAGRAVEALCGDEGLFTKRTERAVEEVINPETGEVRQVLRRDRKVTRFSARYADLGSTLRAIRDHQPAQVRRHGGRRTAHCAEHPEAGTITEQIVRCKQCRRVLEAPPDLYTQVAATSPGDEVTVVPTTQPQDAGTRAPAPAEPPAPGGVTWQSTNARLEAQRHPPGPKPDPAGVICLRCRSWLDVQTMACPACGPPLAAAASVAAATTPDDGDAWAAWDALS